MQHNKVSNIKYADRVRLLTEQRTVACVRLTEARKTVEEAERIIAESTLALAMLEGLQDVPAEEG